LEPAIVVKDLSYAYNDDLVVDQISFAVAPGEILGFLGPNGAGKSTAIKMLIGLLKPAGGSIRLLGTDAIHDRGAVQPFLGVSFEEKNLYADLSAKENLDFWARLFDLHHVDISALLDRVGLTGREKDRVSSYSKGMKQRLMVARAIINQPRVLFLDEPTDGLDPVSSRDLRALIKAEAERGAAVLLTTHNMLEAEALSDRIAFIDQGKIIACDTAENLKLEHGKRNVRIRARRDGKLTETVVALDEENAPTQIAEAVATKGLISVHTEEATLEQIFIDLAGRKLTLQ
jgi:ABC-2 type transport system ATP-binding protein